MSRGKLLLGTRYDHISVDASAIKEFERESENENREFGTVWLHRKRGGSDRTLSRSYRTKIGGIGWRVALRYLAGDPLFPQS